MSKLNKSKLVGSGIGLTTLNNGLTYGNYPFGTRVEDDRISLNEPDIVGIHGIYESRDTDEASAPTTTSQHSDWTKCKHCRSFGWREVHWIYKQSKGF